MPPMADKFPMQVATNPWMFRRIVCNTPSMTMHNWTSTGQRAQTLFLPTMACKTHGQLSRQGPDCRMLAPMPQPAPVVHACVHWIAQVAKQWRVQDAPTTSQAKGADAPWAVNANSASPTSCDMLSGTPGRLSAGLPESLPHVSPWELQNHNTSSNNTRETAKICRVTQTLLTEIMMTTSLPRTKHLKQRRLGRGDASTTSKATAGVNHCRLWRQR